MLNTPIDQEIRSRIDAFLSEISALLKQSALESVREALGGSVEPPRRGPGRPRGSGKRGPGRPRQPRGGKRVRRSAADLEKIAARVLAQVKTKAGQRLEEIGRALRTDTAALKHPILMLLDQKKLRTKGRKRGTRYFAG